MVGSVVFYITVEDEITQLDAVQGELNGVEQLWYKKNNSNGI